MNPRNSKSVFIALLFGAFILVSGCSSEPTLTPEQRQILQSRFFSGLSYKDIFQVVIEMLKDSGYQTTQADLEQGIIVASVRANTPLSFSTRFGRDSHQALRQGERMEALLNLKSVDADNVGVRLSLQLLPEYSLGVVSGEEVTDPKTYQRFFGHLQALIKKRIAQNAKR
jgi:hypothetical protein